MTAAEFKKKWGRSKAKESASYQEHFTDLCRLLGHPTPIEADPSGNDFFCFQKGVIKDAELLGLDEPGEERPRKGFADVWKKDGFGWEYKGQHKNLDEAYRQLQQSALPAARAIVGGDCERQGGCAQDCEGERGCGIGIGSTVSRLERAKPSFVPERRVCSPACWFGRQITVAGMAGWKMRLNMRRTSNKLSGQKSKSTERRDKRRIPRNGTKVFDDCTITIQDNQIRRSPKTHNPQPPSYSEFG